MTDKENWKLVFKAEDEFEAEVVKAKLQEKGIEAMLFNRSDSMFNVLDDTQFSAGVLVRPDDEQKALEVIANGKRD